MRTVNRWFSFSYLSNAIIFSLLWWWRGLRKTCVVGQQQTQRGAFSEATRYRPSSTWGLLSRAPRLSSVGTRDHRCLYVGLRLAFHSIPSTTPFGLSPLLEGINFCLIHFLPKPHLVSFPPRKLRLFFPALSLFSSSDFRVWVCTSVYDGERAFQCRTEL